MLIVYVVTVVVFLLTQSIRIVINDLIDMKQMKIVDNEKSKYTHGL